MALLPDPFVKVQLVAGLKLVKTKKTCCMRGTIDPFYNESFSFHVSREDLREASLVFTGKGSRCFGWGGGGPPTNTKRIPGRHPTDRRIKQRAVEGFPPNDCSSLSI